MQEIHLDLTPFEDKLSLHRYLREALNFPLYYGANLDALYDELSSETEEMNVCVRLPANPQGKMADYLPRLRHVFEDAAESNYHLTVSFE